MIYNFKGMIPVVHPTAYVHPAATVIGHVTLGEDVYIGPGAVLRGDWGRIVCDRGSNVQENCVIHMFPGATVTLGESAHIGHGAIVHGAQVGRGCLVGMNAVLMDDVEVGEESIVGALSFLRAATQWAPRSLIVGNPARVLSEVSDELYAHKAEGTALYQSLPASLREGLAPCEPLEAVPESRPETFPALETWPERKASLSKRSD